MFTLDQKDKIEQRFISIVKHARNVKKNILDTLENCNGEEAICLKYLYVYMPKSDLADYSGELFLNFIRHALKIRKLMPWGNKIEPVIFLNYVLQYRINNENIEFYSGLFFEELYDRVKNYNMYEAAVEVNYWCYEKATYRSTDDRTASPLTVLKSCYGRCGEESTLCVAALRSICIPARQCYAPRWAHCDDNHAWVEAWIDGEWHFMGACEPELRLDTGWFRMPASKAMLVHSRVLSDLTAGERIAGHTKQMAEINILHHYATTKEIKIRVVDEARQPLKNIKVQFEVVNYAEFYPLTILKTDLQGEVSFETGLGDLMIYVHDSNKYCYEKLDVRKQNFLELVLPDKIPEVPEYIDFAMVPPEGGIEEEAILSLKEEESAGIRFAKAAKIRKEYEATFYQQDSAAEYALNFENDREQIAECLIGARGNYPEIIRFLEDEETEHLINYKVKMLMALPPKDLTDCSADILKDHLICAMPFQRCYEDDLFVPYLLCPRINKEMLTAYRSVELEYFAEEALEIFKKDPYKVFEYVESVYKTYEDSEYSNLTTTPAGILKYRKANALSKRIFLVSILRTMGLPARMDKEDGRVCCYVNGKWDYFEKKKSKEQGLAVLRLNDGQEAGEVSLFSYYKNYTVSYLKDGTFITLDLEDIEWEDHTVCYELQPGVVRIITAERQSDGSNLVRVYYRNLQAGAAEEVQLTLLKGVSQQMEVTIPDRHVYTLDGEERKFSEVIRGQNAIVAWLQVGAEPTEHLLNEIIESAQKLRNRKINLIAFIAKPEEYGDVTLQKAIGTGINMRVMVEPGKFDLDSVYQSFHIKDKILPLAVTINSDDRAAHAFYGYQVGIGEMLIKNIHN